MNCDVDPSLHAGSSVTFKYKDTNLLQNIYRAARLAFQNLRKTGKPKLPFTPVNYEFKNI